MQAGSLRYNGGWLLECTSHAAPGLARSEQIVYPGA
jgi:hypothetical protein